MSLNIDSVALLDKVIRISNSTVDIDRRLNNLLGLLSREFAADKVCLFTLDDEGDALVLRGTDDNNLDEIGSSRFDLSDNFIGRTAYLRESILLGSREYQGPDWPSHEFFKKYKSLASFPIMDDQYLYGVLTLLTLNGRDFSPEELSLIEIVSREMAGTIRNSKRYIEAKKRIAELSVLFEVSKATSASIELDDILDNVVTICAKVLMAEGCALNVLDKSTNRLRVAAEFGHIPKGCRLKPYLNKRDLPLISPVYACVYREEPYIGIASKDPYCPCMREEGGLKSILCLPLVFKGQFSGTLSLYNKMAFVPGQRQEYNRDDLHLMTTMGAIISNSLENALTFQTVEALGQSNEALVLSLRSLYQISGAMLTTVKRDELLAIIINALTHQQGLGFDRALIFLLDEDEEHLIATALSPMTEEDRKKESVTSSTAFNYQKAVSSIQTGLFEKLNSRHHPLSDTDNLLVQTVHTQEARIVKDAGDGEWSEVRIYGFGNQPFAAVPMLAKGKVVGVLIADRAFTRETITSEDLRNLSLLANQAGLAIENARLYEYIEMVNQELSQAQDRLLEVEKLAALGEIAAGMAHEIRNPLVSIGGFTRRILKKVDETSPIRPYIEVIIDEVTRLEKTLHDILDFARDEESNYSLNNLNAVVEEALYLLRRDIEESNIQVEKDYLNPLPQVYIDKRQLRHLFFNLFLNARQAMENGGTLFIKTFMTEVDDMPFVACEVSDTGPGIPSEVLPNIFNPFFTTKDSGAGLGLSIVHKIISRHSGVIDVLDKEEGGAAFIVKLPAAKQNGSFVK
ncbi:MAG: GAF domain-containing protein [Deltaproteobacteria bacterium]|nr:GAF domain-containing protein [Deltaproteobacteria bacterium]